MKTFKLKHIIVVLLAVGIIPSCSLDEKNLTTVSTDKSYTNKAGFEGLINSCYNDLYFLHGKVDYITPTEAGTDLWLNIGNSGAGFSLYDSRLNTTDGTLKTIWGSAYSTVNLCNTAILYAKEVKGYASEQELNARLAEVYFLRAFANFLLVEQFGDVVLTTQSALVNKEVNPTRSSESAFYDQIFSDLKYACENLPLQNDPRGRVTKKAAYAMLAKAYLQRTRLGDVQQYAKLALEAAEELINNPAKYSTGLYQSDETRSGFSKLWDGNNNKNNLEFLMIQANDHIGGLNPEWWNRGRTRQYYLPDLGTRGAEWGTSATSIFYGRANSRMLKPSKYLLTEIFTPSANTADTRFAETFTCKFYAASNKTVTAALANSYKKDPSIVGHEIKTTLAKSSQSVNYYQLNLEEQINMTNDEGLAVFTPNWVIPVSEKSKMPYLIADPSDWFDPATNDYKDPSQYPNEPNLTDVYPAMKKFSAPLYAQSNQYWLGDMPVIRLGDIYLVAAEAALLAGNDQTKATDYVNALRRRAAVSGRQAELVVPASQVTMDFIVAERARELAGEHWRWYDLKRTGKLTKSYFARTNPQVAVNFDESKHTKRPIPQSFLDAISNAEEFGTNGY